MLVQSINGGPDRHTGWRMGGHEDTEATKGPHPPRRPNNAPRCAKGLTGPVAALGGIALVSGCGLEVWVARGDAPPPYRRGPSAQDPQFRRLEPLLLQVVEPFIVCKALAMPRRWRSSPPVTETAGAGEANGGWKPVLSRGESCLVFLFISPPDIVVVAGLLYPVY